MISYLLPSISDIFYLYLKIYVTRFPICYYLFRTYLYLKIYVTRFPIYYYLFRTYFT